jgi:dTDP-4-dehydrorhamnose 3,5-epimerase
LIFTASEFAGVYFIDLDRKSDERGFFARTFCANEFAAHGLNPDIKQANLSFNAKQGTLRGMHYQLPPKAETKVVRCTRGSILDVIIDLRPPSPTYRRHLAVELTADTRRALYIPEGFAHGFQTLEDSTEVEYLMGEFYAPGFDAGFRYDDPAFAIDWPLPVSVVSERDLAWEPFA